MKILLIAGHGEGDPGAIGNGFKEADLTREVVAKLYDKLKDIFDVTVYDTNKNLYKQRGNGLNFKFSNYDLCLEVHFNAGGGKGAEVLIHNSSKQKQVDINMLTNLLDTGLGSRGIKKRTDLSNMNCAYKQGAAYSLLEVCFIDSPNDMNIYKLNKSAICSAIANGIVSAYKDKAKTINNVTELFNVNDIVWELEHRGIITEKKKWLDKLQNDMDSYWLARKALQFIRSKNL